MQQSEKVEPAAGARATRSRKSARSWGDINLTLNRLVREGVISTFKTNLSSPDRTGELVVAITPGLAADLDRAIARVSGDLASLVEGMTVTVEQQQAA